MPKDLRSFMAEYEAAHPEDVFRIEAPLNSAFECSAVAKHLDQQDQYPLVVFQRVISPNGRVSPHPSIINVVGDRGKMAFALGCSVDDAATVWSDRIRTGMVPPVVVDPRAAPCKERVLVGDQVDLRAYPILRIHEMDPGPYITAGLFTCHDPATWTVNSAYHRGFIAGPREIRVYLSINTHAYYNLMAHAERDQPMKAAFWVGHHPAVLMGAHSHLGYPGDHYQAAGAVAGEPLPVVPSETLGDDFLVPAAAEFVIEGVIRPGVRKPEGPFGEYPRYYGPQLLSPVMSVTAITHRHDAIWDTHMVGMVHDYGALQDEHYLCEMVKKAVPQVTALHVPRSGCGRFHCYVQMRKSHSAQPRMAIMVLLGSSNWLKHVVVVDEDVDIRDDRQVLWAIATRFQADRDLVVVDGLWGSPLDPSTERGGRGSKMGIDATMPAPPERYPLRTNVPADVMARIRLADLIPDAALQRRGIRG